MSETPEMDHRKYASELEGEQEDEFDSLLRHREQNMQSLSSTNIMAERQRSMEKFLRLEKIIHGDLNNYSIPSGRITPRIAAEIIEVYKRKGRLSVSAVHRLLRLSYKNLRMAPNITNIQLGMEEKLVIVGDLHGMCL